MAAPQYKLSYFNLRARAELTRLLFHASETKFEDFRYPIEFKDGKPISEPFGKDKLAGKFAFGQLPVLEVEGTQIAQSHTIERFVARRLNMMGGDDLEAATIDAIHEHLADVYTALKSAKEQEDGEETFMKEKLPGYLKPLEDIAAKTPSDYFVGKSLSFADVAFYYIATDSL
eukprot:938480_1